MNHLQQIVPGLWLSPLSITAVAVTEQRDKPLLEIQAGSRTHFIERTTEECDLYEQAEKVVAMVNEARRGE